MAEARKFTKKIERTVTEDKQVVELTITDEEVKALITVLGNVAGSPHGPRSYIDAICEKLLKLGYNYVMSRSVSSGIVAFEQDNKEEFIKSYNRFKFN